MISYEFAKCIKETMLSDLYVGEIYKIKGSTNNCFKVECIDGENRFLSKKYFSIPLTLYINKEI